MMGQRALITGGAGFIGSHIAAALVQQGAGVRILDNLSSGQRDAVSKDCEVIIGDVDDTQLVAVKKAEALKSDAEVIAAVIACIRDGVNTKMRLVEATAERAGTSKRNALKVLEKYTGDDPDKHRWTYHVANRGAKFFKLINGESS